MTSAEKKAQKAELAAQKKAARANKQSGGEKKQNKVGFYIVSLLKYFNIITVLPITCLLYVIFFATDIVDGISFLDSNKIPVIVMISIMCAALMAWTGLTFKKRRVCSLDAFLLIGLLLCIGMILQCIILKHFSPFDNIAIITIIMTVFVLALMTLRLCLFKPSEQNKNDDARYVAKSKIAMYLKVIFSKYAFFISMLCIMGILLILIITRSTMFEKFEFTATQLEKVVTFAFAAVALVLMVIGLFIRLVRGRANIVDCMPYMFILVAIGGLIYFLGVSNIYMILYISIGSGIVGVIWLLLCQYTLLMSVYRKREGVEETPQEPAPVEEVAAPVEEETVSDVAEEQPNAEEQTAEEPQPVTAEETTVEETPVEEQPVQPIEEDKAEEPVQQPVEAPVEEEVVEQQPVEEVQPAPAEEKVEETPVEEQPAEEPKPKKKPAPKVVEEEDEDDDEDEDDGEGEELGAIKSVKPRWDYATKLKLTSDDIKAFYADIKNELLSYGIKNRVSKTKENFNKGRDTVARIALNGKTMKVYLALDPKSLDEKYYHHKDMSDKKAVEDIPTMMPVRSKTAVNKVKELIAMLAQKIEMPKKPKYKSKDFAEELSAEELTLAQRKGYGYLIRSNVKLEDVEQMPDDFAEQLADVTTEESKTMRFIKTTVTLDELAEHFDDGDTVTIDSVREAGIGAQNANYLIVEDGPVLGKKLKVFVDEITPNAIKMIALAGGEVSRIWRKM